MNLDTNLFYKINHLPHNKFLDGVALLIHYLTYYGWIFAVPVIYYFFSANPERKLLAKQMGLAMIIAGVINDFVIQLWIARPRPSSVLDNVITVGKLPTEYSFPSGHTAIAFAFATVYFLAAPRSIVSYLIFLAALIIGIGRVYMGFHYPSDVVAGALLGVVCALASVTILKVL